MPVATWFSHKVEKRFSEIEGVGLFAIDEIQEGELVVAKGGTYLTWEEITDLGPIAEHGWYQIGDDLYLAPA